MRPSKSRRRISFGESEYSGAGHNSVKNCKIQKGVEKFTDCNGTADSDWIKQTKQQNFPYFPQVGDMVVYCYEGHQLYVDSADEMPRNAHKFQPQEVCQVADICYEVNAPNVLCTITLALMRASHQQDTTSTSEGYNTCFSFKYLHTNDKLDFLVLESLYKVSTSTQWNVGDMFRSLIDGTTGSVTQKRQDSKNSNWKCYGVVWSNSGKADYLCPWEMEPFSNSGGKASLYFLEVSNLQKKAMVKMWGGREEPARILKGLELVCQLDEASTFCQPVDVDEYSDYHALVAFPTDLSTIKKRLQNKYYRSKCGLLWELVQMAKNTMLYHGEASSTYKKANVLVQTLWKFIVTTEVTDPKECLVSEPEELPDIGLILPQIACTTVDQQRASEKWVKKAKAILEAVICHPTADQFHAKPDGTNIMDLNTVETRLSQECYSTFDDFISDVRLIFEENFKLYRDKKSEMYKKTANLHGFFEVIVGQYQSPEQVNFGECDQRTGHRNSVPAVHQAPAAFHSFNT